MVILVSKFLNENSVPFRYKAPRHFMYIIEDIHWSGMGAAGNRVLVFDYALEDEVTTVNIATKHPIAFFDTTLRASQDVEFTTPLKTKFISIALDSGVAFQGFLIIAGNLVQVSKTELLIEWFRKGR